MLIYIHVVIITLHIIISLIVFFVAIPACKNYCYRDSTTVSAAPLPSCAMNP